MPKKSASPPSLEEMKRRLIEVEDDDDELDDDDDNMVLDKQDDDLGLDDEDNDDDDDNDEDEDEDEEESEEVSLPPPPPAPAEAPKRRGRKPKIVESSSDNTQTTGSPKSDIITTGTNKVDTGRVIAGTPGSISGYPTPTTAPTFNFLGSPESDEVRIEAKFNIEGPADKVREVLERMFSK